MYMNCNEDTQVNQKLLFFLTVLFSLGYRFSSRMPKAVRLLSIVNNMLFDRVAKENHVIGYELNDKPRE